MSSINTPLTGQTNKDQLDQTYGQAKAEFGTFTTLRAGFGIPRSSAYELEKAGDIKFSRLRKRGNQRGRVLINLDSVREYLKRCASQEVSK